ncbi:Sirohydrochlorin cobaltochelatase [[Clostridium] hylemonae DSM 15053]|nr:Sirohydrochlorin cobaltochelatase [[Clostridium] hylemonae DSM 15053]BDF05521.1 sirohydrochlorin cobaltochelatase [[Clostridium] hylemonae]
MEGKTKRAVLVVSFGTSHMDALKKSIEQVERHIEEAFPTYRVYRAFTSQMILRKLKRTQHLDIFTVKGAMEQMAADGMEEVIVQPTHIINGIENDKMMEDLMEYTDRFKKIRAGRPLLTSVDDYKKAIHAVMAEVELKEGEALVLMGHGTDHHANAAYPTLEYTFHSLGYSQVLVGTVEGFPDLRNVMTRLEISGMKKVMLMPFMVVAGDHAKNDMAGEDDSWKTELEAAGYEVRTLVKGLGEMKGIRNIYAEHIEAVM